MNTLKRLLIALALIAGFSSSALLADPAAHAGETPGEHAGKPAKKPRVSRVEKLNAELTLTEEQKSAIAAIYKEENAALKIVSDDKSLERAARIAKNKEIRTAHAAKVRALLTADQQLKFDALAAKPAGKEPGHDDKS